MCEQPKATMLNAPIEPTPNNHAHVHDLQIHEAVKQSGLPNYKGCRIPLKTRWNCEFLTQELRDYDDNQIVEFCRYGWPISITNTEFKSRKIPRNHKSARDYPDQMSAYIAREQSEGTLMGPFQSNPFSSPAVVSPLSTTEKKDSNERRVLMDLSFPHGDSVNDKIPKNHYLGEEVHLRYPSLDSFVELVVKKGRGCAMMKCDLRRAYKQIWTDPGDWNFLGICWDGSMWFDKTMPMGLRTSALCCQRITNAMKHIMEKRGFDLVPYLDDTGTAEVWEWADDCFKTLRAVIKESGAEEAENKAVFPTCEMVFLGVLANSLEMTLEVSAERLEETMELLDIWLAETHMNRKQVESVAGKLGFIASCVRPGRLFISRVLEFMRGLPPVGKFEVPKEFKKDLLWWKAFLPSYNGVSMMAVQRWCFPDEVFASDACLSGCGAWFCERSEYFHLTFPDRVMQKGLSINALELLTVVVAAKVWGRWWRGKRIVVHCDNEVSVTVMNTGRSHNSFLLSCLRELEFVAARNEFEIRSNHIAGVENRIPDALSRWHLGQEHRDRFHQLTAGLNAKEVFVYEGLFEFIHDW